MVFEKTDRLSIVPVTDTYMVASDTAMVTQRRTQFRIIAAGSRWDRQPGCAYVSVSLVCR